MLYCRAPIRPDLLFRISRLPICVQVLPDWWSLFVTSKYCTHPVNLQCYSHERWICSVIMTVLKWNGRWSETINLLCMALSCRLRVHVFINADAAIMECIWVMRPLKSQFLSETALYILGGLEAKYDLSFGWLERTVCLSLSLLCRYWYQSISI